MTDVRKVDSLAFVPVDAIHPNKLNPRQQLHDIHDLAASIKAQGLIQPLVVSPQPSTGGYRLISGHRRLAALIHLGQPRALCVIRMGKATPDMIAMMLVENGQRVPLSAMEEARAYQALITEHRLSQKELGKRIGRSQTHVSQRLALLHLTPEEQQQIDDGDLLLRDARQTARVRAGTSEKTQFTGWHLGKTHPLAGRAGDLCRSHGNQPPHTTGRRLGGIACGECWEQTIREDERTTTA